MVLKPSSLNAQLLDKVLTARYLNPNSYCHFLHSMPNVKLVLSIILWLAFQSGINHVNGSGSGFEWNVRYILYQGVAVTVSGVPNCYFGNEDSHFVRFSGKCGKTQVVDDDTSNDGLPLLPDPTTFSPIPEQSFPRGSGKCTFSVSFFFLVSICICVLFVSNVDSFRLRMMMLMMTFYLFRWRSIANIGSIMGLSLLLINIVGIM
jgi:hypothetical protein